MNKSQQYPISPYPIWLSASTSALLFPFSFKGFGLPHPIVLGGLSVIYTGIGFLMEKDPTAGSSVASAWGIIHLILAKKALKKKVLGISHLGLITIVTGMYLKEFIQDF
jgi:hypothetical protein